MLSVFPDGEMAARRAFLCSKAAAPILGAAIPVDGACTAQRGALR